MASPPPIAQPVPSRSPTKGSVDLRHPTPDLQSLQGAYVGNIGRLEEHAERMSEAGSDLGEEIRKMHSELKRSDSRKSSYDEPTRQYSTRSRNVSTSSHANSIVDLNGPARWGGYSPGGYITSPVGSLRSGGSWSNSAAPSQRQRSESKASRLGQVVHPEEVVDMGRPESPQSQRSPPSAIHPSESPPPQDTRKVSSFTRKYEEIANDIRNSMHLEPPAHNGDQHHSDEYLQHVNHHDYPDRPHTAASTDTTRQARTLWQDFDGDHCPDTVPEEDSTPSQGTHSPQGTHSRQSSGNSVMRSLYEPVNQGAPPPDDGMVFYPAPVPRMLNLPKRLSQLPQANVQARRRTQLLDAMQAEKRQSAPLLSEAVGGPSHAAKKSRHSMALPAQLRASAYFDQVGPAQEFAVRGESAEDTLESILDASARAPVSAFTDHPIAGRVGNEVYGPEHKRKTSKLSLAEVPPPLAETRRRSSFMGLDNGNSTTARRRSSFLGLDTSHNSSGDPLNKLKKRNSSADMNLLVVRAGESRVSLGDELDERDEHARGPESQYGDSPPRRSYDHEPGRNPDDVYDEEHAIEEEEEEHEEEEEEEEQPYYGPPTTLLAELQLRKAKQKTRNMNYVTLVEQGNMPTHRTLLQLDDMAEREKQRRLKKKVNLAWEAQKEDDSDDDVPLGVLYQQTPPNQRRPQTMAPVGLIAQREREERETLSRRRARLRGDSPGAPNFSRSQSQLNLAIPTTTTPGPATDEDEGETLADRMRRLREKKEREHALGDDHRKSTISVDFANEMMSKFGGEEDKPKPTPSPGPDEEETLGQRRARLQAEAALNANNTPTARPHLRPSLSMADILSANPLDVHNTQTRKLSDQQLISNLPQNSLLAQNVVAEERRKADRLNANMRASSYGSYDPLIRAEQHRNDEDMPLAMKIQAYKRQTGALPAQQGMMYNGMGNMSAMNLQDQQRGSMMPQMMGMGMMSQPNLSVMPQQQMPMMMGMNSMGMMSQPNLGMMNHQQMPMMMGMNGVPMQMQMNGMQMGMNGMMMPPMDPRQRDNINQWMAGVGP